MKLDSCTGLFEVDPCIPKYTNGDVVYIYGVTDPRTNEACRGVVDHSFVGHLGVIHYVISIDILDGGYEVRDKNTMWDKPR